MAEDATHTASQFADTELEGQHAYNIPMRVATHLVIDVEVSCRDGVSDPP